MVRIWLCDARRRTHNIAPDFAKGTGFAVPTDEERTRSALWFRSSEHFITRSCNRRMPLLASPRARGKFVEVLSEVRDSYDFGLFGYVSERIC